jgi:hypothetical protein
MAVTVIPAPWAFCCIVLHNQWDYKFSTCKQSQPTAISTKTTCLATPGNSTSSYWVPNASYYVVLSGTLIFSTLAVRTHKRVLPLIEAGKKNQI